MPLQFFHLNDKYYEVDRPHKLITVFAVPVKDISYRKIAPSYLLELVTYFGFDCRYADSYLQ